MKMFRLNPQHLTLNERKSSYKTKHKKLKKDLRLSSEDKETNNSFVSVISWKSVQYLSFNVQAFQPSLYLYLDLLCLNDLTLSCKCPCQYFNNKNDRLNMSPYNLIIGWSLWSLWSWMQLFFNFLIISFHFFCYLSLLG